MIFLNEGVSNFDPSYEAFSWRLNVIHDGREEARMLLAVTRQQPQQMTRGACSCRGRGRPHRDVHSDCSTSWNIRSKQNKVLLKWIPSIPNDQRGHCWPLNIVSDGAGRKKLSFLAF
jgi:hypothetical protein